MVKISMIVPVLNEARMIEACLERLSRFREHCEIIVVDGGSQDETAALARPLCDQLIVSPRGRAKQMNAGAEQASGCYLFFVHGDTVLSQDAESLVSEIKSSSWGFAPVKLSGSDWRGRVIGHFIVWRSRLTGVATGDQMMFVKRSVFKTIGGFANIPLMEDIEISKRLRKLTRPRLLSQPVVTSSRRWRANGYLKTVLLMWWLRLAYFMGVSPDTLAQYYYGRK